MGSLARQRTAVLLLFLVPGMAYLTILRIAPAVFTLFVSFTHWNLKEGGGPVPTGFTNYVALAGDSDFLASVMRTLVFTVVSTAVELVLGLLLALLVNRAFTGRRALRVVLLVPMIIAPPVVGMIWYILLHETIGPANWLLSLAGLGPVGWLTDPRLALTSIIIADVWHWTPFMFLLCLAGLQTVPAEVLESAAIDGASRLQTIGRIVLPIIRETILVAIVLRSMNAFEIFAEPFVMTGGGPGQATETLSIRIYQAAFQFFDMGRASAMIVVSIVLLLAVYSIYLRATRLA